jgi:hypothetical protein
MKNGKKSARAKQKRKLDVAMPRALLRKHARIKKNGHVELKKGWSDKKIAKKAKAEVQWFAGCAETCTPAFASRSCASPVFGNKALQPRLRCGARAPSRARRSLRLLAA